MSDPLVHFSLRGIVGSRPLRCAALHIKCEPECTVMLRYMMMRAQRFQPTICAGVQSDTQMLQWAKGSQDSFRYHSLRKEGYIFNNETPCIIVYGYEPDIPKKNDLCRIVSGVHTAIQTVYPKAQHQWYTMVPSHFEGKPQGDHRLLLQCFHRIHKREGQEHMQALHLLTDITGWDHRKTLHDTFWHTINNPVYSAREELASIWADST